MKPFQHLLNEVTLANLVQSTENNFSDKTDRSNASNLTHVQTIEYVPGNDGILRVVSHVLSKGNTYEQGMEFDGVEFKHEKEGDVVELEINGDEPLYITPIQKNRNDVRVTCTCMDFRFRFAYANYQKHALIGKPMEYNKVPGSNRPPVNPTNEIGMCKHLISLSRALAGIGVLK